MTFFQEGSGDIEPKGSDQEVFKLKWVSGGGFWDPKIDHF